MSTADLFLKGNSTDCSFVTDPKGIETASFGEGVKGSEIPRKALHLLSRSGEVGAERLIRDTGK